MTKTKNPIYTTTRFFRRAAICVSAALVILAAACFTPAAESFGGGGGGSRDGTGEVTFTVLLPRLGPGSASVQSARTASHSVLVYPPDGATLAALDYVVDFISASGVKTVTAKGQNEVSSSAPVGPIQIDVRASLDGHPYASGSMDVVIKAGGLNYFDIPVYKAEEGFRAVSGTVYADTPAGPLAGVSVQLMQGPLLDGPAVRTGTDGTWRVDNIAPGDGYYIVASKAGYITGTGGVFSVSEGSDAGGVNLTLSRVYAVSGTIYGDDAAGGLSGASVQLADGAANTVGAAVTTGPGGTFSIPGVVPGSGYTLTVSKTGYLTGTSPAFTVDGTYMGGTNVSLLNTTWLTVDFSSTTVTSNTVFDAASGAAALETHLNGLGPGSHVVTVTGNQHEFTPTGSSPASAVRLGSGVKVSLRGTGELGLTLTVDPTLPPPGSPPEGGICVVQSGAKLVLRGPVLKGRGLTDTGNSDSLVIVDGGELFMYDGNIRDNVANRNSGGVHIESGGTFTMSGGTISGNYALAGIGNGGGVCVANGGTFNMSGTASITQNQAGIKGGGVYVESGGTFSMSDGTISGNTSITGGGGVYVDGTFNISSLTTAISANTPDEVQVGTGTVTGTASAGW